MNGVLNIYKPQKMSSFDVVRKIRNLSHTKKVGHTGTLIACIRSIACLHWTCHKNC